MNIHYRVRLWKDSEMDALVKMIESGSECSINSAIYRDKGGSELHVEMEIDGEGASVVLPTRAIVPVVPEDSILILGSRFTSFYKSEGDLKEPVFRVGVGGQKGNPECKRFGRWLGKYHRDIRAVLGYERRGLSTQGRKRRIVI